MVAAFSIALLLKSKQQLCWKNWDALWDDSPY